MKQQIKYSVLIAALLGLSLAGCQKKEEAPVPEMPASEAPAPEAMPAEPMAEPVPMEPAPTEVPMEPVPGEAGEAAPMQPDATPSTPPAQ
jgi:predicted small lipoprotein YifL